MEREFNDMYGEQSPRQIISKNKSILKAPKLREPLQELDLIHSIDEDHTNNTMRTSTRRVSFAKSLIKEFRADSEVMTLWGSSYYEEAWKSSSDSSSHQTDSSNSGLSSTSPQFKVLENKKGDDTSLPKPHLPLILDQSIMCQNSNILCNIHSQYINHESPVISNSDGSADQYESLNKHRPSNSKNVVFSSAPSYNREAITKKLSRSELFHGSFESLLMREETEDINVNDEEICRILPRQDFKDRMSSVICPGSLENTGTNTIKHTQDGQNKDLESSVPYSPGAFQKKKRQHTFGSLPDIENIRNNDPSFSELDSNMGLYNYCNQNNKRHKGEHFCANDEFVIPLQIPLQQTEWSNINNSDLTRTVLTSNESVVSSDESDIELNSPPRRSYTDHDSRLYCADSQRHNSMEPLNQSQSAVENPYFQELEGTPTYDTSSSSDSMDFTATHDNIFYQLDQYQQSLKQDHNVVLIDTVMKVYSKKQMESIESPLSEEQIEIVNWSRKVPSKRKRDIVEPPTTQLPQECIEVSERSWSNYQEPLMENSLLCTGHMELPSPVSKHNRYQIKELDKSCIHSKNMELTNVCSTFSQNQTQTIDKFSDSKENIKYSEQKQSRYHTPMYNKSLTYGRDLLLTDIIAKKHTLTELEEISRSRSNRADLEYAEALSKICLNNQIKSSNTYLTDKNTIGLSIPVEKFYSPSQKSAYKTSPSPGDTEKYCTSHSKHKTRFHHQPVNRGNRECIESNVTAYNSDQTEVYDECLKHTKALVKLYSPVHSNENKVMTNKRELQYPGSVRKICSPNQSSEWNNYLECSGDLDYTGTVGKVNFKNKTKMFDNSSTSSENVEMVKVVGKIDSDIQTQPFEQLLTSIDDLEYTEAVGKIYLPDQTNENSSILDSNKNEAVDKNTILRFDESFGSASNKNTEIGNGDFEYTEALGRIHFKNKTLAFDKSSKSNANMEITEVVGKMNSEVQTQSFDEWLASKSYLEYTEANGKICIPDQLNENSAVLTRNKNEAVNRNPILIFDESFDSASNKNTEIGNGDFEYTEAVGRIHFKNQTLAVDNSSKGNENMEITEVLGKMNSEVQTQSVNEFLASTNYLEYTEANGKICIPDQSNENNTVLTRNKSEAVDKNPTLIFDESSGSNKNTEIGNGDFEYTEAVGRIYFKNQILAVDKSSKINENMEMTEVVGKINSEVQAQPFDELLAGKSYLEYTEANGKICIPDQSNENNTVLTRNKSEAVDKNPTLIFDESSGSNKNTEIGNGDFEYTEAVGRIYFKNQILAVDKSSKINENMEMTEVVGKINSEVQAQPFDELLAGKSYLEYTEANGKICIPDQSNENNTVLTRNKSEAVDKNPTLIFDESSGSNKNTEIGNGDFEYTEAVGRIYFKNQILAVDKSSKINENMEMTEVVGKINSEVQAQPFDELLAGKSYLEYTEANGKICIPDQSNENNTVLTRNKSEAVDKNPTLIFDESSGSNKNTEIGNGDFEYTEAVGRIYFKNQILAVDKSSKINENMEMTEVVGKINSEVQAQPFDELLAGKSYLEYTEANGKICIPDQSNEYSAVLTSNKNEAVDKNQTLIFDGSSTINKSMKISSRDFECTEAIGRIHFGNQSLVVDKSHTYNRDIEIAKAFGKVDAYIQTPTFGEIITSKRDLVHAEALGEVSLPDQSSERHNSCISNNRDLKHIEVSGKINFKNQTLVFDKSSMGNGNLEITNTVKKIDSEVKTHSYDELISGEKLEYNNAVEKIYSPEQSKECSEVTKSNMILECTGAVVKHQGQASNESPTRYTNIEGSGRYVESIKAVGKVHFENETQICNKSSTRNGSVEITKIVTEIDSEGKMESLDELVTGGRVLKYVEAFDQSIECNNVLTSNSELKYTEAVDKDHSRVSSESSTSKINMERSSRDFEYTEVIGKIHFKNAAETFYKSSAGDKMMEITTSIGKTDSEIQIQTSDKEELKTIGKVYQGYESNALNKSLKSTRNLDCSETVGLINFKHETQVFDKSSTGSGHLGKHLAVGNMDYKGHTRALNDVSTSKVDLECTIETGKIYPDLFLFATKKQFSHVGYTQTPEQFTKHSLSSQSSVEHRSRVVHEQQVLLNSPPNKIVEVNYSVSNSGPVINIGNYHKSHGSKSADVERITMIDSEDLILPPLPKKKYCRLMSDGEPVNKRSNLGKKITDQEIAHNAPTEATLEEPMLNSIDSKAVPSISLESVSLVDTTQEPKGVRIDAGSSASASLSHGQPKIDNTDYLSSTTIQRDLSNEHVKVLRRNNCLEIASVLIQEEVPSSEHIETEMAVNNESVLDNGNISDSSILHLSNIGVDEFDVSADDISCKQAIESLKTSFFTSGVLYTEETSLCKYICSDTQKDIHGEKISPLTEDIVCQKELPEGPLQKSFNKNSCTHESVKVYSPESVVQKVISPQKHMFGEEREPQISVNISPQKFMTAKTTCHQQSDETSSLMSRTEEEAGTLQSDELHPHDSMARIKTCSQRSEKVCPQLCTTREAPLINTDMSQNVLTKEIICSTSTKVCTQQTTVEEEVCLQKPETVFQTVEELIRRTEAEDNCLWSINELSDQAWSFYFLYKSLKLVVQFNGNISCTNRPVADVCLASSLTDKADPMASFVLRTLLRRMCSPYMRTVCKFSTDIPLLLCKLSLEVAKMMTFMRDMVRLEIIHGVQLRGDCATFSVRSLVLHCLFSVTVDLSKWERVVSSDVSAKAFIGTVREEDIRQLVNGVAKGPHFLLKYVQHVHNYVSALEKTTKTVA